jgi:hypothetical protein
MLQDKNRIWYSAERLVMYWSLYSPYDPQADSSDACFADRQPGVLVRLDARHRIAG